MIAMTHEPGVSSWVPGQSLPEGAGVPDSTQPALEAPPAPTISDTDAPQVAVDPSTSDADEEEEEPARRRWRWPWFVLGFACTLACVGVYRTILASAPKVEESELTDQDMSEQSSETDDDALVTKRVDGGPEAE
jgi:hypothetical protein